MTDRDALEAFTRNETLDQPTIRRLLESRLITVSDVTSHDTAPGQREYLPIAMTLKGQRLLDKSPRAAQNKLKIKNKKKKRSQTVKNWLLSIEIKAAV